MTPKTFEDYLKEKHGEEYTGTDDNMPDAYEAWLGDINADDFIQYGNMYGELRELRALKGKGAHGY
jgi:hypothetical protein